MRCPSSPRAARPLRVALSAVLLLVGGGCGGAQPAPFERANVLLIVVDTLGARHVGTYDAPGVETPHIDGLADSGALFEHASSTAPWTQPSVASIFTSRMPSKHGVTNLLHRLPDDAVTLAERFSALGYRTHATVSHFLIGHEFGYEQGFDELDASPVSGHDGLSSPAVTDGAIRFLESVTQDERFFLFAHYFDPHFLYRHHEEFDQTSGYGGNLVPAMPVWALREMRSELRPKDLAYIVGLYREEIAYTDHHIGRLLTRLRELGLDENTLIVFTADHGEEFMEHGWIGHTRTLFDDLLHVPLIIRPPGGIRARTLSAPVSTLDIAPTVLELVSSDARDPDADGRSHAAAILGREDDETEQRTIFAEVSFDPATGIPERVEQKRAFKTAVVRGNLKLVHDLETDAWDLFDRERDPLERRNLWGENAARDEELRGALLQFERARETARPDASNAPDEEKLERLRDLGYVH